MATSVNKPEADDWVAITPKAPVADDWTPITVPEKNIASAPSGKPTMGMMDTLRYVTGGKTDEEENKIREDFKRRATNPRPNPPADEGPIDMIKRAWGQQNSPDVQDSQRFMTRIPGLMTDLGLEGVKRVNDLAHLRLHKGGLGAEEWGNALRGNAIDPGEGLSKYVGLDPVTSTLGGIALGGSALNPKSGVEGMKGTWNAMQNQGRNTLQKAAEYTRPATDLISKIGNSPVGNSLQWMGKKIFSSPFKKIDASNYTKYPATRPYGPHSFTEDVWNKGNPEIGGFGTTNAELGDQVSDLKKVSGKKMDAIVRQVDDQTGNQAIHHLAPELEETARDAQLTQHAEMNPDAGMSPDSPNPEDSLPHPLNWLKSEIALPNTAPNGVARRNAAVQLLTDSVEHPRVKEAIQKSVDALSHAGDDRAGAINSLHDFIDNMAEGRRTLHGTWKMGSAISNSAAKSQPMGTDYNAANRIQNTEKMVNQSSGRGIGQAVHEMVMDHLPDSEFGAQKQRYHILSKAEKPMLQLAASAAAKPVFSKLDKTGAGLATAIATLGPSGSGPAELPFAIGVGGASLLHKIMTDPRLGTGVGKALNAAGKMPVWDNFMRYKMMNAGRGNN